MTAGKLHNVLSQLGNLVAAQKAQPLPDQELLNRFVRHQDEGAFAALMERHGPMVLGVCGRVLRNPHDAEDACQAVFLVLARKAASVRKRGSIGSWLHGVAWRVARKLRASQARRTAREMTAVARKPAACAPADLTLREALQILDEELNRMPQVYKAPLVLCYLGGRTQDEAARELGWPLGTLHGRLERARHQLRSRLTRRGVTASAALAAGTLAPGLCSAAVPPTLVVATVHASLAMAAGETLPATIPTPVVALAQAALRGSLLTAFPTALAAAVAGLVLLGLAGLQTPQPAEDAPAALLVETWPESLRLEGHKLHAWCVAYSPDGKLLASGAGGYVPSPGELKIWDAATGQALVSVDTPRSVRNVAFTPDGQALATVEHDGLAHLREVTTGHVLRTFKGHRAGIDALAFSPDGRFLATVSWDKSVRLWETDTAKEVWSALGVPGQRFAVAHDGATVASGGVGRLVRLWDAATGQPLRTLDGHREVIQWLGYSPDGKILATAGWDRMVKLWEPASGKLLATLRGHAEPVMGGAFAPDGRSLATCGGSWGGQSPAKHLACPGEVIVWDLDTHQARVRLRNHPDRVFGVAFAPEGTSLAFAGWDGSVTICRRTLVPPDAVPKPVPPPPRNPDRQLSLRADMHNLGDVYWIGPHASQCVQLEPAGLRITLPAGYPGQRPDTGARIRMPAQGDFEATVNFEILAQPDAASVEERRTRLMLTAVFDRPDKTLVAFTRRVVPGKGSQFTVWGMRENHEGNPKRRPTYREVPTESKAGRLRIVRTGEEVAFLAAERPDAEFTLVHKMPCGDEDLESIELTASTGSPKAALDVRFTDLRVRTGTSAVDVASSPAAAVPRSRWKSVVVLAILSVLGGLSAWLFFRSGSRGAPAQQAAEKDQAPPARQAFPCGACGKTLHARAELAGKKVKCPLCGQAVMVPGPGS